MLKKFENKKFFYVYCGIIILQLLTYIYWANMRSNFFVDELYSMGYASNYLGIEDTAQYITLSDDWEYDEWISNSLLKKQLLVSERESVLTVSAAENVKSFLSGRNYFWLLNFAESILGDGNISGIPGMVLNIVLLLITEIVLICFLRRLKMGNLTTVFCLAMFGLSGFFIGLVEYIRFYMLVTMLAIFVIMLHYIIWTTDRMWKVIVCETASVVFAYLMLKNSEMTIPFMGGLIICFVLGAMFVKKWKLLSIYAAMPLMAFIYILLTPKFRNILFNLAEIPYTKNIFNTTIRSIGLYSSYIADHLIQYYFGHAIVVVLWCLLIAIAIVCKKKRKLDISIELNRVLICGFGLVIAGVFIAQGIVRSLDDELIVGLCLSAFLVAMLYLCFPWGIKIYAVLRKKEATPETQFVFILVGTFLIYSIFVILTKMSNSSRYCFPAMMIFMIVFWYPIDKLVKKSECRESQFVYFALTILVVLSCMSPYFTRQIEYICEEEKTLINDLEEYQGTDTVLIGNIDEAGNSSRHEVYDCINLMNAATNIYPIDKNSFTYVSGVFPEEFILWNYYVRDIEDIKSELQEDGYRVDLLGETHASIIYYCSK